MASPPEAAALPAPSQTKSLLRDPDFRNLYLANAVSRTGTQITLLAMPVAAAWALNASAAQVGILGILNTIAFVLIGLPAGVWVDRMRRRAVMAVSDLLRGALLASIPLAWWLGILRLWQLDAIAFSVGVLTVFADVAAQSYLPALVPRQRVTDANTKLASWNSGISVVGPGTTGLLLQIASAPALIVIDAVSYFLSAAWVCRIRRQEPPLEHVRERHMLGEIAEGIRWLAGNPLLRPIAISGTITNLASYMIFTTIPVLFRELHLSGTRLGIFMAVNALGFLLGSVTGGKAARWLGEGRSFWLLGLATTPFALLVPYVSPGILYWAAAVGWLLCTYRIGMNNVLLVSFRQRVTPDHLLGRMNATVRFLFTGALSAGAALAGLVGQNFGTRVSLWVAVVLLAVAWLPFFFSPFRSMRDLPG